MTNEQIIFHGHTPQHVWQDLAQRSRQTRIKIVLQCPQCHAEIHPTINATPQGDLWGPRHSFDTTHLRCLSCDVPVEIYQHREMTETADTRIIYTEANGQHRALLTLELQCLSCERRLQADETCKSTCGIQTYLVLDFQDGELYIKRAANLPHVQRDTPFIPIRNLPDTDSLTRAKQTPHTDEKDQNLPRSQPQNQNESQPNASDVDAESPENPNAHIDIAGQIVEYLTDAPMHTAGTAEMVKAIGCSRQGFNVEKEKLIEAGKIRKVTRGVYQLINP